MASCFYEAGGSAGTFVSMRGESYHPDLTLLAFPKARNVFDVTELVKLTDYLIISSLAVELAQHHQFFLGNHHWVLKIPRDPALKQPEI